MQKISLTIRVDPNDLERWQQLAGGPGKTSAWMRKVLNECGGSSVAEHTAVGTSDGGVPIVARGREVVVRVHSPVPTD